MTISRALAQYIVKANYADFPAEVIEAGKGAFLDWLGSAFAGADKEPGKIVLALVEELGGNPEATLLSTGRKSSSVNAALLNGAISHTVELDDVHKASILHAGAAVIPAALAAAEKVGADGKSLLEGIVVGFEVGIRIGEAVTPAHYYYWHTTGTVGTFGAAAAAGKILGLSEDELVHTLGTAGTQAAGLWEFLYDGAMSKHLHPGKACMNGLLSALLAKKGFTGASRILEGEKGFIRATANDFDLNKITDGLGLGYKILENCYKIHSSCRHTHHAVDIVLDLAKKHNLKPENVQKVVVKTYPIAIDVTGNFAPNSLYAAKFSLPFCVSLALKAGKAGINEFNLENLHDPEIRDLIAKTELVEDVAITALYPERWPAEVEITDLDGNTFKGRTDYPLGDPENQVSTQQLEDKFTELAAFHYGAEKINNIIAGVRKLEQVTDLSALVRG
ncbi:MAG TPA: MmgE/PrpD family protein, partial [Verrucomicrobiae bacterium]|nr:MmgE/PrpD family protein [Verrucomicrobiae bacterium]